MRLFTRTWLIAMALFLGTLAFAQDGALVKQLTQAFGGIDYMPEGACKFIENWEVESYRSKQL